MVCQARQEEQEEGRRLRKEAIPPSRPPENPHTNSSRRDTATKAATDTTVAIINGGIAGTERDQSKESKGIGRNIILDMGTAVGDVSTARMGTVGAIDLVTEDAEAA